MNSSRIYGLIGWPLGHSLSPKMHNAAFKFLGINAEYKLFPIAAPDLDKFLSELGNSGISGLNVTVPYKEKVLDFVKLDKESLYLRKIKAVNTMRFSDGSWRVLIPISRDLPGTLKKISIL